MKLKNLRSLFTKTTPVLAKPPKYASPPPWFVPNDFSSERNVEPCFLYQSWLPEHTDKLVNAISGRGLSPFVNLGVACDASNKKTRVDVMRFAERQSELYDRMVMHKLAPFRRSARGLIVTLDWIPAMRRIVYCASRLGIPTILVPHESVFADESMFYVHPKMGMNVPICDLVLAWGDTQERIFSSRGYPSERIVKVGAPKFDYLSSLDVQNSKDAVRALGLDPAQPVVTFAVQPLDSQYDTKIARVSQNNAIQHLVMLADEIGYQLIIRTPPSKDSVLDAAVYEEAEKSARVIIDDASVYILSSEETIAASDVLVSINSTMLLEAALAGKVAITAKYVEFEQIWDGLNIPIARGYEDLKRVMISAVTNPLELVDRYNLGWAASAFGTGQFDGAAALRVKDILAQIESGAFKVSSGYAYSHAELLAAPSLALSHEFDVSRPGIGMVG